MSQSSNSQDSDRVEYLFPGSSSLRDAEYLPDRLHVITTHGMVRSLPSVKQADFLKFAEVMTFTKLDYHRFAKVLMQKPESRLAMKRKATEFFKVVLQVEKEIDKEDEVEQDNANDFLSSFRSQLPQRDLDVNFRTPFRTCKRSKCDCTPPFTQPESDIDDDSSIDTHVEGPSEEVKSSLDNLLMAAAEQAEESEKENKLPVIDLVEEN